MAVAAFALPAPVGAPIVDASGDPILIDWADVVNATKYSVDIEGVATYDLYDYTDPLNPVLIEEDVTADVQVSFGTSDRTDGDPISDSDLDIAVADLAAAIAAQLGIPVEDLDSLDDATAKVKALNAGNGKGKQNNPFSDPSAAFSVTF